MAERTAKDYENGFKATRKCFSALAKRIREGYVDSHNARSIQAIRNTVMRDCQVANNNHTKYLKIDATNNNEDYATLGVLGPKILNGLQLMINSKLERFGGDQ